MKIAVLSGKGGTGKTLVSVNLASVSKNGTYIDCDVEAPNGHLFFKPEGIKRKEISVKIPVVNQDKCSGCRKCVDFCKFNALAFIGNKVKVFETVCHSCGGCKLLCPEMAIDEKDKVVGAIETGESEGISITTGILNTGEETGVPIIKELLKPQELYSSFTIIDCPPGSSCMVMESIKDVDYCVLVAEPTLFGSHNLEMVYELVKLFEKPFGCVLNKCVEGENPSADFCKEHGISVIESIPFDINLGTINSNAGIIVRQDKAYFDQFSSLLNRIRQEVEL